MRISWHPRNAQASAVMLAGLIAMPIAVLPGHVAPTKPVTATATAGVPKGASHMPPASVPSLTIDVSDGRTAVKTGDQLTYVVGVHDGGTRSAPHLKITQNLVRGPGVPLGQPPRYGRQRAGRLVRRHSGGRHPDLPRSGAGDAATGPAAPAGGGRLRRGGRQQQADCLCGPPRSVACRCGRAGVPERRGRSGVPGRQALRPGLAGVCRGGPGGACGRRARDDRIPSPPPAPGRA